MMLDRVLAGMDYCFVYLDNTRVASRDHTQHDEHLMEVLARLQAHGLVLNSKKCPLGVSEADYLGHCISASGIRPLVDRVAAIRRFEQPTTARGLQTFLSMVNLYSLFLKDASLHPKPLTDALKGGTKEQLTRSEQMASTFEGSKDAMLNVAKLSHLLAGAELSLAVDASGSPCGGSIAPANGWRRLSIPLLTVNC